MPFRVPWQTKAPVGTYTISPPKVLLKMMFLFPRWDMLVPWRVTGDGEGAERLTRRPAPAQRRGFFGRFVDGDMLVWYVFWWCMSCFEPRTCINFYNIYIYIYINIMVEYTGKTDVCDWILIKPTNNTYKLDCSAPSAEYRLCMPICALPRWCIKPRISSLHSRQKGSTPRVLAEL